MLGASSPHIHPKLELATRSAGFQILCSAPISHTLPVGIASSSGARLSGSGLGALTALRTCGGSLTVLRGIKSIFQIVQNPWAPKIESLSPVMTRGLAISTWKRNPFVFDTFFLKASISDVDPNLRRQLLCSINFNTDPGKHERGFGISLLLHIKWLTYSTSNPSYNIGWPEVEPELREPYPHRDALQEVFTDIQSSFPFLQDENPTTNKPRSAFEHFGAIFPQQELKEEKAIHFWNDLKSPSGFPDLREVFIEIFERRASPNK